jgi:hypothetical protein
MVEALVFFVAASWLLGVFFEEPVLGSHLKRRKG